MSDGAMTGWRPKTVVTMANELAAAVLLVIGLTVGGWLVGSSDLGLPPAASATVQQPLVQQSPVQQIYFVPTLKPLTQNRRD